MRRQIKKKVRSPSSYDILKILLTALNGAQKKGDRT